MRRRILVSMMCVVSMLTAFGQVPITRNKTKKPTPVQTTPKQKPKNNNNAGKKPSNNVSNGNNGKSSPTTFSNNKTFTVGNITLTMLYVQGGTFTMGATSEQGSNVYDDEKPSHSVTLSSYYIGETEVTQGLWEAVMGTSVRQQRDKENKDWPLRGEGVNYPMYYISWDECKTFVSRLNSLTGQRFRLPTEAEWEYAARGGRKSQHYKYSGSNTLSAVAWYEDNSGGSTHPVKTKSPNELGLYDMSGNVWEWCQDRYGDYSSGSQTNPAGPSSGSFRVSRGGSWHNNAWGCRVSYRGSDSPDFRIQSLGLRLSL